MFASNWKSNNFKINNLSKAIERARQYAQTLEERDRQDRKYGMLLFLLGISIIGLVILFIRRFA